MLGDFLPTLGSRYLVLQANSLTGPAGDNAADVGMTIPSSDEVVELVVANELNTEPIADAGGPYVSNEGSEITFDASRSTDAEQSSDSLTYQGIWTTTDRSSTRNCSGRKFRSRFSTTSTIRPRSPSA